MRTSRAILAVLLAWGVSGCGAAAKEQQIADYPRYSTVAELVERADLIVEGVAGESSRRDYQGVSSDVWPVTVAKVWRGSVGAVVEVKRPSGEPHGLQHDRGYLLFLETYPDSPGVPASTLNIDQAVYPLAADGTPTSLPGNELRVTIAELTRLADG